MIPQAEGANYKGDEDEDAFYAYKKAKEVKWYHKILLNRPLRVIVTLILLAIVLPTLLYRFLFYTSVDWPPYDGYSLGTCLLPRTARLPCGLGAIAQSDCHPQCCYDIENDFCFHRFPSRFSFLADQEWAEDVIFRPRISTVPFRSQNSLPSLKLSIDEVSSTHLSLMFYDPREMDLQGRRLESKSYEYEVTSNESNVIVKGVQGIIFNTARGPLIASENIWEITFQLTNETIYGLGEIPLQPGTVKVIYNHDGGLSSVPLIYAKINGYYHGLLIDTPTPTEITIQDDNNIILRSITNLGLKLHLFVGPEPKDIMRDVVALLGNKKQLEYWMLGAHICSENINDGNPLDALQSFITNASSNNVPYDSHCGTKPIVFTARKDEDEITSIENGAEMLRTAAKKFVPHVSPYIRFDTLEEIVLAEMDNIDSTTTVGSSTTIDSSTSGESTNLVFDFQQFMLQWNTSDIYNGSVYDESVAYPDYELTNEDFLDKLWSFDVQIDGVVLENNWPLDDSTKLHETYEELPYFSESFRNAFNSTPQWAIIRPQGRKYIYEHNEYSNHFINAFHKIVNNIPVWSTSQRMKNDVVINRQNIDASWTNLQKELVEAALGGISGHWYWSSPICGDTHAFSIDNQVNLCVKWYMAATYFPLIKIHSNTVERHPLAFQGTQRSLIMNALNKRLRYMPYFYTVLQEGPLLRPMFYQFPLSDELSNLTSQFSVGDDLLIAPNLLPSQSHVHIRMPPGTWYEFLSGLKINAEEGEDVTMTTSEADLLTLVRGGSIIVTQTDVKNSADETRKTSLYSLIISTETKAIIKNNTQNSTVEGKLFISDSLTIHFNLNGTNLLITAEGVDFEPLCGNEAIWANVIKQIKIYGLEDAENNYDHHKQIATAIELCQLKDIDEIVFVINNETV